jgi:Ca-activated chloride channel family protein
MKYYPNTSTVLLLILLLTVTGSHASIPKHISDRFTDTTILTGRIIIRAPDIAENGAVVPVSIDKVLLDQPGVSVKELWIFDEFRNAPIARFKLTPSVTAAGLSTRIKLARTSAVYAIALLSDGTMISGSKTVKVTIGGCGGGNSGTTFTRQHTTPSASTPPVRPRAQPYQGEKYSAITNNGVVNASLHPVSTFSIDVDTGSYSNIRRFLMNQGVFPSADAVRVEELVNYFPYRYPAPPTLDQPFAIHTEMGPAPWSRHNHLLRIGIKGYEKSLDSLPPSNLVFLVDVSGSMKNHNKLGLLKASLKLLTRQLRGQDSIAIVVYAGASGVVLEPTPGDQQQRILAALDSLEAGGSTNGGAGIQLAYAMARQNYLPGGINRVILATDGDFNVGVVNHDNLMELITQQRLSGISLTTLGFGTGNYNEKLMEQLADKGNGNYAYIDTLREARKVLVNQLAGTLLTIAQDVKVQVEFNPAIVAEYRLIGYENRLLRTEDFKNDKVDAGDIGAGHTVTAFYEVAFIDSPDRQVDPLRYQSPGQVHDTLVNEVAFIKLRYKRPGTTSSREIRQPIYRRDVKQQMSAMSDDYRFASAVAAFGQILRGGEYTRSMLYVDVQRLAGSAVGHDEKGYRREFLEIVDVAGALR